MPATIRRPTAAPAWLQDFGRGAEREIDRVEATTWKIRTITVSEPLALDDYTILANAVAGAVTVALPPASQARGRTYHIKKIDATANAVTLDGSGSETIDGAATKSTTTQWASYSIQSSGTGWFIL